MTKSPGNSLVSSDWPEIVRRVRDRTPARLLIGRIGAAYRTDTQIELRQAHAAARDAVRAELDIDASLGADFVKRWELLEVSTQATSRQEYLLRPDLGRRFNDESRAELLRSCSRNNTLQIAIGDGLSITAISKQVPPLLPLLHEGAKARGWSVGRVFVIRHCRVGILNEIGEMLAPQAAILLIGERPGLATAESLSAYMAFRPKAAHTDANRNLVSNIHPRGVRSEDAARRILDLTEQMMKVGTSGCQLREQRSLPPNHPKT
jgi:ethanolamine ammonia-lyase small subunit